MIFINCKTYVKTDEIFPKDVKIILYSVPGLKPDTESNEVSVIAYSVPNTNL